MDWLIPFGGIAVVVATMVAANAYLSVEGKTDDVMAFNAMLERLHQDWQLTLALSEMHGGKAQEAAQRLDLLVCAHILWTDAELASAGPKARPIVMKVFQEMGRIRPSIAQRGAAGSIEEWSSEQIAAERVLGQALGITHTAQAP